MRKYLLLVIAFIVFSPPWMNAQSQTKAIYKNDVDYSWVPRASAYEAYVKYKEGKAIILHAGGEAYKLRHIVGAFNMEKYNDSILLKFPKKGIEVFTYCY